MLSLARLTYKNLHQILLTCGPFESDDSLRTLFIDDRIALWRYEMPHASSPARRVELAIDFLLDKQDETQENGLILMLHVLQDSISFEDSCHTELTQSIKTLHQELPAIAQPASTSLPDEPHPYRNLDSFTESSFFFGRECESAELWQMIQSRPFIAVVGTSGQGKSSLVQAGLFPFALQAGWTILRLKPFTRPLYELGTQLGHLTNREELVEEMMDKADAAAVALLKWFATQSEQGKLLIFIDQFEELFTRTTDEKQRQQFIATIANLTQAVRHIRIVVTLRTDFLDACLQWPELKTLFGGNQFVLSPLTDEGLRSAIERPAAERGAKFEKGLVAAIMRDVAFRPEALPLLQSTLYQLWQKRVGIWLTHEAYEELGGVSGAITTLAENAYTNHLTSEQQALTRQLFLRLLEVRSDDEDNPRYVRRSVKREEVNWPHVALQQRNELIEKLAGQDARLITADEKTIELTHEALVYHWERLQQWLTADYHKATILHELADEAQKWDENERDKEYLFGRRRWQHIQDTPLDNELNVLEIEFLRASRIAYFQKRGLQIGAVVSVIILLIAARMLWLKYNPWQPIFTEDPVTTLAYHEDDYYMGTKNTGVWRLQEETWVRFDVGLPTGSPAEDDPTKTVLLIDRLLINPVEPRRLLALVAKCGLYLSEDGAETWRDVTAGLPMQPPWTVGIDTTCNDRGTFLDAFDVLDVDFVGDWTFLLWNSSLYVNHGDEWSWYLAADVQRLPEGNIWAVAIDVIGQEIFLATSTGLYKSALAGMWEWQAVIELPEVFLLTAVDNSQVYYFVSYDESINESAIYRWQVGQLPELMGTLKEPPIQLAPDPNPNQKRVYVLNFSGQVWVITPPPESAPRLLGNELFFALNLLTVPNLVAEPYHQLWLADELGLFQYRLNLD